MTTGAERDQVVHHVPSKVTPRLHVMNLQVLHGTAVLAPPSVSFHHLISDHRVLFRVQLESWLPLAETHRIRRAAHNEPFE